MPKRQSLSGYLEQIKFALDKQDWTKAKRLGEMAVRKLPLFSCSPDEKFLLYYRLGYAYSSLSEFSVSLDFFYKAHSISSKHRIKPVLIAANSSQIALNLVRLKLVNKALEWFQKTLQYYQAYGYETPPMNKLSYISALTSMAYCYSYENNLRQVEEIIEEKLSPHLPQMPGLNLMDYYHLKGEYLMAVKKYADAREAFNESIKTSGQIDFPRGILQAKIHLAQIELIEGQVQSACWILEDNLKIARRLKLSDLVCELGLFLSKCYHLLNLPEKASGIENRIKKILNKLDTSWLYEKTREFERFFRQLHASDIPQVLTRAINQRYEKSSYTKTIIGNSTAMRENWQLIEKIAPTDLPILIQGETGTGKELIAHAIHQNSLRLNKTYFPFNCGAIPETLIESHLFGHTRGAFTDAKEDKKGCIELASGGTLFVDEISSMSPSMQQKLLRVMEEKLLWKVGASKPIQIDTRFIFASNQDIEQMVKNKLFREDLFYRINTIVINLPPLRDRKDDIPLLIQHFLQKYSSFSPDDSRDSASLRIPQSTLGILQSHPWPGNVRELENEIKRICALYPNAKIITETMLSAHIQFHHPAPALLDKPAKNATARELLEEYEKDIIKKSFMKNNGNIRQTAHQLGYERRQFYRRLKHLNIRT
ncbi:MAG: sigma 54-interacting transcriptional regulator [Planctomycetes bacterium]|nr:sigma 54-interacting transcriptional regulator [Planctomycetota bacterium]